MSGTFYGAKQALCLSLLFAAAFAAEECDKTQCKGPIMIYKDLNCKPIFENPGDCCAVRYDCSHLEGRSTDKCYANGKEYAIGDELKDEDRDSPCDIGCMCVKGHNDVAQFTCAAVDCFNEMTKEDCYFRRDFNSCCGGKEICPKSEKDKITCEVDGKVYTDNDEFYPSTNPDMVCQCSEGYKGENVAPFCRKRSCGTELRRGSEIHANCIPEFYSNQDPRTSCSYSYRCPNDNDSVIRSVEGKSSSDDMLCKFGNMTMNIGDELNQPEGCTSCGKCVCEVPPTPTCRRL